MNASSAKRYFDATGQIFVVEKMYGIECVTVRIKRYECYDAALRYVQKSKTAHFVNKSMAKRLGYDIERSDNNVRL